MSNFDNDIPKYIKKKQSSVSKSKEKSKHKHQYVDCLLIDRNNRPHRSEYCKICGKIRDVYFFETEKIEDRYHILSKEQVFEKYRDLEKKYINSFWDKYVSLEE